MENHVIDPLQKGVVRLRTAILEYNKKMAHSLYTRSALSCKLVFMGETFVGRLLDLFSTKIKIQQFIKVCECSFMQKDG